VAAPSQWAGWLRVARGLGVAFALGAAQPATTPSVFFFLKKKTNIFVLIIYIFNRFYNFLF
jgi:hypothetical protein